MDDTLNKAQRLVIAGVVAPSLRSATKAVRTRRVKLTDKDGNVVREQPLGDWARGKEPKCYQCRKKVREPCACGATINRVTYSKAKLKGYTPTCRKCWANRPRTGRKPFAPQETNAKP